MGPRRGSGRPSIGGYGVGRGGLYGALHDRVPALSKAAGVPFGLAFALVGEEGLYTALKLTLPPRAFPMDDAAAFGLLRSSERACGYE